MRSIIIMLASIQFVDRTSVYTISTAWNSVPSFNFCRWKHTVKIFKIFIKEYYLPNT
uniref:Candidate secreted effector n=1 Tax=Meloidogyne incognita TaxID=6306 RepID=A0A914KGV1_MELIC